MKSQQSPYAVLRSKEFLTALIVNFIWINLSEVFRYFVFVMPMMRDAFPNVIDVAPMSIQIFFIWVIIFYINIFFNRFFNIFFFTVKCCCSYCITYIS